MTQTVTIDDKEYDLDNISGEAKNPLPSTLCVQDALVERRNRPCGNAGAVFYIGKKGIIIAYFLGDTDYSIYFLFKDIYARRSNETW